MAIDSGATAWILAATALVMIMTPGVGFFYGGLVRRKNLISMITLSFVAFALVSIQWVLIGYSLAFGPDIGGFIGNLQYLGLNNVGMEPGPYSAAIPGLLYMVFQLVFATVTMAIVTSGFAERIKFSAYLVSSHCSGQQLFTIPWPTGYGVAAGQHSSVHLTFAGGTVVHISSGFAALALALVIGKRVGFGKYAMEPNNIPLTILGAALLWFGWFGFNAGSAVGANGLAAQAFVTTNTAAAAGAMAWMLVSWMHGKPSSLGFVSGAVAGLVAITPGCGYVTPMAAMIIGIIGGAICYGIMLFRIRKGLDESLDAWAIHGMGGLWGALATGIFAVAAVNGASGLIEGNVHQFIAKCSWCVRGSYLRVRGHLYPCSYRRQDHRPAGHGRGRVCRS